MNTGPTEAPWFERDSELPVSIDDRAVCITEDRGIVESIKTDGKQLVRTTQKVKTRQ